MVNYFIYRTNYIEIWVILVNINYWLSINFVNVGIQ